jgi:hypothetical protein
MLLVALALIAAAPASAATAPGPGITGAAQPAYDLNVSWFPRGDGVLFGTESVSFTNLGTTPLDSIWLRTWANGPDHCHPRRLQLEVTAGGTAGRTACTAQQIVLETPVQPGATSAVAFGITIHGRPDRDRFGTSKGTALLGDVIPVLAITDRDGVHIHEKFQNLGESFYAAAGPWTAEVSLPRGLHLASTGHETADTPARGRHTVTVETPHARSFGLAIGALPHIERTVEGVTIRVFGDKPAARRSLMAETAGALKVFQRRYGPYGSPEFDVVETRIGFFGMEYPEMVMEDPDVGTAAHELAHQWWFGIVGDDEFHNAWLDETLASYSDGVTYTGFDYCRGFDRLRNANVRLDEPMSYWIRHRRAYGAVVYGWGACQLHRLEKRAGRPAMNRFFGRLVSEFRYAILTPADFARVLTETMPARIDVRAFLQKTRAIY